MGGATLLNYESQIWIESIIYNFYANNGNQLYNNLIFYSRLYEKTYKIKKIRKNRGQLTLIQFTSLHPSAKCITFILPFISWKLGKMNLYAGGFTL